MKNKINFSIYEQSKYVDYVYIWIIIIRLGLALG